MAKKIRFPLEMENEIEVRSMEELRQNFSISRVLSYLKDGKLEVWLRDRFEIDIADKIGQLDLQAEDLTKRLCEIFDTPYNEKTEEKLKKAEERAERILLLKKYTDDKQFEEVIDSIAFNQDELYDFLDEDADTIYLCGEKFSIPLAKEGVRYIGINQPIVVIDSKVEVDWVKKNIIVENVVFDWKYQIVVERSNKKEFDLSKILAYLDINYELMAKKVYEYNGKILFFEHKMRTQKDNDHRDSSILYSIDYETKKIEFVKHLHEQDFQSQRILDWIIYKDSMFYISSCQRGVGWLLKVYNFTLDSIRHIDSWRGNYCGSKEFLEIVNGKLRYGTLHWGLGPREKGEIVYEKLIDLY